LAVHRFKVGQRVALYPAQDGRRGYAGLYTVTQLLPSNGAPNYRIRSEADGHDRMVAERELHAGTADDEAKPTAPAVRSRRR
jgi:hypothetical protein